LEFTTFVDLLGKDEKSHCPNSLELTSYC